MEPWVRLSPRKVKISSRSRSHSSWEGLAPATAARNLPIKRAKKISSKMKRKKGMIASRPRMSPSKIRLAASWPGWKLPHLNRARRHLHSPRHHPRMHHNKTSLRPLPEANSQKSSLLKSNKLHLNPVVMVSKPQIMKTKRTKRKKRRKIIPHIINNRSRSQL